MRLLQRLAIALLLPTLLLPVSSAGGTTRRGYFPPHILDRPLGIEPLPNGNILITDAGGAFYTLSDAALLEIDPAGRIAWSYAGPMAFPHSAERLPDGTTLVSDTANDRVFRVDGQGRVLWTSDDWGGGSGTLSDGSHLRYPNDAELLDNGRLLITDRNNDRAIEVTWDGEVAWQYGGLNRPHNADRLPNGHTLICDSEDNVVLEVDPSGRVVWKFGDAFPLRWPRDADRLPNGHTLVTDTRNGRVLEVTPEGLVVWSYGGLALPYEADRLEDGSTLIADNDHKQVLRVDATGKVVWRFRNFVEAYPKALQNGDLEEDADADGIPDGWYPADMNAEGPVGYGSVATGDASRGAKISYTGEGRAALLQAVAVEPGKTYLLSGRLMAILTRGVAAYQVWFVDELGGPIGEPLTAEPTLQGQADWQEAHLEATAPAGAAAAQIWCQAVATDGLVAFDAVRWSEKRAPAWIPWLGAGLGLLLMGAAAGLSWRRRRPACG